MAHINSDAGVLVHLIGDSDTAGWSIDNWKKVVEEARKSAGQGKSPNNLAPHNGCRSRSVSPTREWNEATGECDPVDRLVYCVSKRMIQLNHIVCWTDPSISTLWLAAAALSWLTGLVVEFFVVALIWGLSGCAADFQSCTCADGDAVFDQLAGWIAEEFSGLPQSSRAALFAQMLFLPGLAFGVSCVIWPPAFQLLLVSCPFLYGLTELVAPQLAPYLRLKCFLLLPRGEFPPVKGIPPLRPVSRERRLYSMPSPESSPWNTSPLHPPASLPAGHAASPEIRVSPGRSARSGPAHAAPPVSPLRPPPAPERPLAPTSLTMTADNYFVGRVPVRRGGSLFHEAVLRVVDLHHSDGWEMVKSQKDMTYESKVVPWASTKAVRFITAFDCPLETLGNFLMKPENSFKVDSLLEKKDEVEKVDDNTVIMHNLYKSPVVGVGKREFVIQMTRMYLTPQQVQDLGLPPKRTFIEAAASCDHPACPPTPAFIRSKSFCAGYVAQEDGPRRLHVINLGSGSPEGWIPSKVADAVSSTLLGKIQRLQRCVEAEPAPR
eukprot:EG_transcript_3646